MRLRPYADRPTRRGLQLAADLAVAAWTWASIWAAVQLHQAVTSTAAIAFRLRDGAGGVAANLNAAGGDAGRVPLVWDALSTPLRSAGGAAGHLAGAGQQLGDQITTAALPLAVGLALLALLPAVTPWLALRWHYARQAGATSGLAASPSGTRLLALRALTNQPTHRLIAVAPDPVAGWQSQDAAVTAALADLELRRLGLRAPS
jgi:hypothetical protein